MKKIIQIVLLAAPLIVSVAGSAVANHEKANAAAQAADAATVHAATISAVHAAAVPAAVPEPSTFILFGAGAAGFILYKKFKK